MKALLKLLSNPTVTTEIIRAIVKDYNRTVDYDLQALSVELHPEVHQHVKDMGLSEVDGLHLFPVKRGGSPIQPSYCPF